MSAVVRFVASVLAVSGVLLLIDAGLTLAWQEPISAVIAQRQQDQLEDQLAGRRATVRRDVARLGSTASRRRVVRHLAQLQRRRLRQGTAVGRIDLPTLDRGYAIVHGTDTATLRKGPAHYDGAPLPGEGGTVAVAGHRTTYGAPFRTIDQLRKGQPVVVTMPYGRFTYRVTHTRIVAPTALWVTRRVGYEQAVLTACHPLYSAAKRIVVFARLAKIDAVPGT